MRQRRGLRRQLESLILKTIWTTYQASHTLEHSPRPLRNCTDRRYGFVIADDSNPIRQLIVRVSDSRAVLFFEDLMTKLRVSGRVEVR